MYGVKLRKTSDHDWRISYPGYNQRMAELYPTLIIALIKYCDLVIKFGLKERHQRHSR
ncbi:MAG: hypothetical protein J6S57_01540 [Alphaproteobacteria bacterium]|nr:hypothetical protein [Alphaproteobacteria bacterium]